MDFTREPIIETIITPRDGFKLVVRNSKSIGQEEYFVESVEVVSFGHSFFFRSLERPKSFLLPINDYEILEVKETRIVLKQANIERSTKISIGREPASKASKEVKERSENKPEKQQPERLITLPPNVNFNEEKDIDIVVAETQVVQQTSPIQSALERRKERRRYRRRRNRGDLENLNEENASDSLEIEYEAEELVTNSIESNQKDSIANLVEDSSKENASLTTPQQTENSITGIETEPKQLKSRLIPPPTTLISDTIHHYKDLLFGRTPVKEEESIVKPSPKHPIEVVDEIVSLFSVRNQEKLDTQQDEGSSSVIKEEKVKSSSPEEHCTETKASEQVSKETE